MSYSYEGNSGGAGVGAVAGGVIGGVLIAVLVATSGESAPDTPGVVHIGADGKEYVLPEDARRAIYQNRDDCINDIREQEDKIKAETDEDVQERPEDLCEATDDYAHRPEGSGGSTLVFDYPHGYYYGPIVSDAGKWESGRIKKWEASIPERTFAVPGRTISRSIDAAPAGSKIGSKTVIRGGLGVSSKGFAGGAAS
jgi:hypothetical protein